MGFFTKGTEPCTSLSLFSSPLSWASSLFSL
nr:MAG TPA: hypothetical protein [Caudoviricetes sp.]